MPLSQVLLFVLGLLIGPENWVVKADVAKMVNSTASTETGCHQAEPVSPTSPCHPYAYPNSTGYCTHVIGTRDVYGSLWRQGRNQADTNSWRKSIEDFIVKFNVNRTELEGCLRILYVMYCHALFTRCDRTSAILQPQPVCRESCVLLFERCPKSIAVIKNYNDKIVSNCTELPPRNGGSIPQCYLHHGVINKMDDIYSKDCYYGIGVGYRGNINATRSGYPCQAWSAQCPHRHMTKTETNASNYCRNPGGLGPDGPWCYTTNRTIRWEYCNVSKCATPPTTTAPTKATNDEKVTRDPTGTATSRNTTKDGEISTRTERVPTDGFVIGGVVVAAIIVIITVVIVVFVIIRRHRRSVEQAEEITPYAETGPLAEWIQRINMGTFFLEPPDLPPRVLKGETGNKIVYENVNEHGEPHCRDLKAFIEYRRPYVNTDNYNHLISSTPGATRPHRTPHGAVSRDGRPLYDVMSRLEDGVVFIANPAGSQVKDISDDLGHNRLESSCKVTKRITRIHRSTSLDLGCASRLVNRETFPREEKLLRSLSDSYS